MGRRLSSSGDTDLVLLSPRPHPISLAPTPPQALTAEPFLAWLVPSGIGESWGWGGASFLHSLSGPFAFLSPWRGGKRT